MKKTSHAVFLFTAMILSVPAYSAGPVNVKKDPSPAAAQPERPNVGEDNADDNDELEKLKYPWVGIINQVRGKTIVNRFSNDGERRIASFDAVQGLVIHEKDELTTGDNSTVTIKLKNNTMMNLAPNSVFKIHRHYTDSKNTQASLFNLLFGGVRASVEKLLPDSWVKLYTNNATIGVRGTEFVVDYSVEEKATKIACFDGEVQVTPSLSEKTGTEPVPVSSPVAVKSGEFAKVDTIREDQQTIPVITEAHPLSDKVESSIKKSFTSNKIKPNEWDFARISSSYFRFGLGYEILFYDTGIPSDSNIDPNGEIIETTSESGSDVPTNTGMVSALNITWMPLLDLGSSVYFEPFVGVSVLTFRLTYVKAGGNLVMNFWRGVNLGLGGGVAGGIAAPGYSLGYKGFVKFFDIEMNYTFLNKIIKVIDGVSLTLTRSFASEYYRQPVTSLQFGIVINFNSGREKW